MPYIRPITDLRNTTEISEFCNNVAEPVFIVVYSVNEKLKLITILRIFFDQRNYIKYIK